MRRDQRLRSPKDFRRVLDGGVRVTRPEFVLYHAPREAPGTARVGFAVGRRVGGAVVRNRARRLLREAARRVLPRLRASDIVIVARPPIVGAGGAEIEAALAEAVARAGLLDRPTT